MINNASKSSYLHLLKHALAFTLWPDRCCL